MTIEAPRHLPLRWQTATIERITHQTSRAVSVFLDAQVAPHTAGQHIDIRLTAPDGYTAQRSYSIASAPASSEIELLIERLDHGEVSPYFHEAAQPGDTVEVRGPIGGHFVWRTSDGGPVLLVAGGSGIAPLMAMARHWRAAPETDLKLVYSARTWEEVAFREELLADEAAEPRFSLTIATTRERSHRETDIGERRLDQALWSDILSRWGHTPRLVYICGSNPFVDAMSASLIAAGITRENIRTERYGGSTR